MRRVRRHDLAGHQPVEHHADAGEMLLDRRRRHFPAELLDIGGDMDRLNVPELARPVLRAPLQKVACSARICRPRVPVADVDREEFQEALGGRPAGRGDQRRQCRPPAVFRILANSRLMDHLGLVASLSVLGER